MCSVGPLFAVALRCIHVLDYRLFFVAFDRSTGKSSQDRCEKLLSSFGASIRAECQQWMILVGFKFLMKSQNHRLRRTSSSSMAVLWGYAR